MTRCPGLVRVGLAALAITTSAAPVAAQGFRASFDLRGQSVATRGWLLDSVPRSDVQPGVGGGLYSSTGYAVTCSTATFCYYYAPGPRLQYAPVVLTTDVTAWGLGTSGLSAHLNIRMNASAADEPFAGTTPAFQFWEGYLSYQHAWFGVLAGRQVFTSRLGFAGFDGGRATVRHRTLGLEATGYVGLGLARASSVGINDPATAPLGDYIPGERNLIEGIEVGIARGPVEARAQWQRQVDRTTDYLMSDFLSGNAVIRPLERVAVAGGLDYDLAQGWVGSAEAEIRYMAPRVYVTAGFKRYMPHFDLWTIWPAFSPVPWNGVQGSVVVSPLRWLKLRGRIEWHEFEGTGAETALGSAAPTGSLWAAGATITAFPRWTFDAGWMYDKNFGAAAAGGDVSIGWTPRDPLVLRLYGAYSQRPLVYRYNDSYVTWAGLDVSLRATQQVLVGASVVYINEDRNRPDAAAFDWNQARVSAFVTYVLSAGGADRLSVPDAVKRMPSAVGYQR
jgi:hypothetical protein